MTNRDLKMIEEIVEFLEGHGFMAAAQEIYDYFLYEYDPAVTG